jgi:acetyltransferase-like isoleucine patch superfamily enzyme
VNIYDSEIGEGTKIATFVEIGGSKIGKSCKIEAHAFIPPGSVIEDYVFIGPHAVLTNDMYPNLLKDSGWESGKHQSVNVKRGARIGGNAVILPGVTIGERCLVGAGAVVKYDTEPDSVYVGNPAHRISEVQKKKMGMP